jgi:acetyl-CoA acetyltransferase
MSAFRRGGSAIVSAATHGLGEAPGFSAMDLAAAAGLKALAMVGLKPRDVDALFVALPEDPLSGLGLAEYLGVRPKLTDNNRTGGSSFLIHAMHAALALDAGECQVALIAYGSNQRSAAGKLITSLRPNPWEAPYRLPRPVGSYALAAARYLHCYGVTRDAFAEVAIAARRWAQLNPDAFMRDELTREGYFAARMVADPLSVRDCCLVTDGAAAIVMTRADRARDLAAEPVYLLGGGAATEHRDIAQMPDLTVTAAVHSGARAFAQSGMRPRDIDVVQLYDAFTINTLLFLEDLGFCQKGEAAGFVAGGRIAPGGALPVNTNGGGLSCTHPGMYGLFTVVEAVEQLTGRAGARQVAGARLALAHGNGGELSSQATLVLGTADTL